MASSPRKLTVSIELTPLGRSLVRLAEVVADCDAAALPDEVVNAAYDVIAIQREHLPPEAKGSDV